MWGVMLIGQQGDGTLVAGAKVQSGGTAAAAARGGGSRGARASPRADGMEKGPPAGENDPAAFIMPPITSPAAFIQSWAAGD